MKASAEKQVLLLILALNLGCGFEELFAINPVNVTNMPLVHGSSGVVASGKYLYSVGSDFQVFDISNPAIPSSVGELGIPGGGGCLAVSGNYCYVTEGSVGSPGKVDILDVSDPTNPAQVGHLDGTWNSLAIVDTHLYAAGSDGLSYDVFVYDIRTPNSPVPLGHINSIGSFAVSGENVYISAPGHHIWDVSDPALPQELGHALGVPDYYFAVAVEGNYAYGVFNTNGLAVFDVSNRANPVLIAYPSCWTGGGIALSGNYAYAAWGSIFTVYDITHPTNTSQVSGGYAPYGGDYNAHQIAISHNYAYFPTRDGLSVWSLGIPAPQLAISSTNDAVVLSWPAPTGAFLVQRSGSLAGANWVTLTNAPAVVGSDNQVTIPAPAGPTFYRLESQ